MVRFRIAENQEKAGITKKDSSKVSHPY